MAFVPASASVLVENNGAATTFQVQPTFIGQDPIRLRYRVEVNSEFHCSAPDRRQLCARLQRPFDELHA